QAVIAGSAMFAGLDMGKRMSRNKLVAAAACLIGITLLSSDVMARGGGSHGGFRTFHGHGFVAPRLGRPHWGRPGHFGPPGGGFPPPRRHHMRPDSRHPA